MRSSECTSESVDLISKSANMVCQYPYYPTGSYIQGSGLGLARVREISKSVCDFRNHVASMIGPLKDGREIKMMEPFYCS